ncbi:MAG: hypothetical protein ACLGIA_13370 [Actinomycetes bacterium]
MSLALGLVAVLASSTGSSTGTSTGGSGGGGGGSLDPMSVSPGLIGFVAVFALIVAAIFLFRSMSGHLRRVDYRSRHGQPGRREASDDERAQESSLEDPGDQDEGRGPR